MTADGRLTAMAIFKDTIMIKDRPYDRAVEVIVNSLIILLVVRGETFTESQEFQYISSLFSECSNVTHEQWSRRAGPPISNDGGEDEFVAGPHDLDCR